MRRPVSLILIWMITAKFTYGQDHYTHLFRLYEDNDYINILGKGTDRGYTNGTRIDYLFTKPRPSRFFIDRWLPNAGPSAINTFGYSLTQLMFVPKDLSRPLPEKNDWPYSGALYITHSLHSADADKKIAVHTELIAGASGPSSFAKNTQTWAHRVIHYTRPRGWDKQMPDDALLNVNLMAEKMIWQTEKSVELIAGGEVYAGTMLDGASLHIQLRFGRMQPYFGAYTTAYSTPSGNGYSRFQFYFFVKPAMQWVAYNALLDGGVINGKSDYYAGKDGSGSSPAIQNGIGILEGGLVLIAGRTSISLTEKKFSSVLKGVPGQVIGNISFSYSW